MFFVSLIAIRRERERANERRRRERETKKTEYYRKKFIIIQCVDVDVSCSWFGVMMSIASKNIDE